MTFELGQEVVVVQPSYRNGHPPMVSTGTITKVGRKWCWINNCEMNRDRKFGIEDGLAWYDPMRDNGYYHPKIYSKEGWAASERRSAAVRRVRDLGVRLHEFGQNPWTTETIERVADILTEPGAKLKEDE